MRNPREDLASGEESPEPTEVETPPETPSVGGASLKGYEILNQYPVRDGREASEIVLSSIDHNEAPRVGVLGDTGCGKTEAMRRLVEGWLAKVPRGLVVIVDDKGLTSPFSGQERKDVQDLKANPVDKRGPRVVILRGDRFDRARGQVDPETAAEVQWALAQQGRPTLGVYDELPKGAVYGQWRKTPSTISWGFSQGRDVQAGMLWGGQETQQIPAEAFNQSGYIFQFRSMGNPIRLLRERNYVDPEVAKVIAALPGHELPRPQRGYFVLLQRGRAWNRVIYRYRQK